MKNSFSQTVVKNSDLRRKLIKYSNSVRLQLIAILLLQPVHSILVRLTLIHRDAAHNASIDLPQDIASLIDMKDFPASDRDGSDIPTDMNESRSSHLCFFQ